VSRWRPKGPKKPKAQEYSIARALKSFSGEEEAQICAFLEEMERARLESNGLVQGWRITRDAAACGLEVMYGDGQISHVRAPTFRECAKQISQWMIETAMRGAPEA
jgi:hypothetical protein